MSDQSVSDKVTYWAVCEQLKIIIDNIDDNEDDDYDGNDKDVLAGPGERKRCATDRRSRTS